MLPDFLHSEQTLRLVLDVEFFLSIVIASVYFILGTVVVPRLENLENWGGWSVFFVCCAAHHVIMVLLMSLLFVEHVHAAMEHPAILVLIYLVFLADMGQAVGGPLAVLANLYRRRIFPRMPE